VRHGLTVEVLSLCGRHRSRQGPIALLPVLDSVTKRLHAMPRSRRKPCHAVAATGNLPLLQVATEQTTHVGLEEPRDPTLGIEHGWQARVPRRAPWTAMVLPNSQS
jgi:hypothetical protein